MKVTATNLKIGTTIERLRTERDINQTEFARKMNVSRSSIVNMEVGRQSMSIDKIIQAAIILDVEISEILPSKEWYAENKDKIFVRAYTLVEYKPEKGETK